jgi:hypothetical protein
MKVKNLKQNIWWIGAVLLLLLGCGKQEVLTPTPISLTPMPGLPISTPTPIPPTLTPLPKESATPLPTVQSLTGGEEQARAFSEPILTAIANLKPDFADDFSTADTNWQCNNGPLQTTGCSIANGIASVIPAAGEAYSLYHPWLVFKNFVLEIDARQVSGSCAS